MKNLYHTTTKDTTYSKSTNFTVGCSSKIKNKAGITIRTILAFAVILFVNFSFLNSTVFAQQVDPGVSPMFPPPGGLAIDGDLKANLPALAPYNTAGDWLPNGTPGGSVLYGTGVANHNVGDPKDTVTTFHSIDLFGSGDDVFDGGSKKNDNPNHTTWKRGNPSPAKCEINHFLLHIAEDPTTGHTWIAISGDRQVTNGNSFISMQFLQKKLEQKPNNLPGTPGGTFVSAGLDSGRTVGDLQVSAEFLNGGGNPNLYLERWQKVGNIYKWVAYDFFADPDNDGAAMGATNAAVLTTTGGYSVFQTGNQPNFTYPANALLEGAIDITRIVQSVGGNDCIGRISTLWVMTKTSQSETARMADFVTPIQINLDINVVADAGPDKEYCAGGSTTIGTEEEDGVTYSWTPSTGLSATNVAQPTANPTSTTSYILTVTKSGSNCSSKDTVLVTVNPIPTITGLSLGAICEGTANASLVYSDTTGGANQFRIDWDAAAETAGLNDEAYATLPVSPINIDSLDQIDAGTYSGIIYVRNSSTGCVSTGDAISLKINPNPVLDITNPAAVCSPLTIDLTAVSVGNGLPSGTVLNYFTNAGATTHVSDSTSVGAGTYYIKAISPDGCTDIKSVTVTVNPKPILSLHNPDAVCSGNTVSLIDPDITDGSTLPNGTVLGYFTNAGATIHVQDSTAVGTGTYYIKATAPGGCTDIGSVNVTVKDELARPVVTITDATLCDTVAAPKLEVLCPVEGGKYTLKQTGETDRVITYGGSGALIFYKLKPGKGGTGFSIKLEFEGCVSEATTCNNMDNECLVGGRLANPKPQPQGSAFTKEMKAYPVPFYDNVTIQFTSDRDEDYVVNLYDVQGRLVKELKAGHSKAGEVMQIEVDGTRLLGNFYVARKISKSGISIVKLLKSDR